MMRDLARSLGYPVDPNTVPKAEDSDDIADDASDDISDGSEAS